jgi:DNA-binding transcriptional regulator LsrR (DeoR family)
MAKTQNDKEAETSRRLDLIAATLLAQSGLTRTQIAQIMGVSEKTIERMFSGNLNKILRSREAKSR